MPLPLYDPTLPTDTLHVAPWDDPVIDVLGHDPRSAYVERFWLSLLGPSTTLLLRRLATEFDAHPEGFDLPIEDTARALGLGMKGGRNSPFLRAIARTGQFHLSQASGDGLHLRRRLPPLSRHQVLRLPVPLRDEHDAWQEADRTEPDVAQRRQRARRLALSLLELGETDEATEQQLHRWKVHPALAHEALRWAHLRRGSAPPVPPPPATTVPDPAHAADGAPGPGAPRPVAGPRAVRPRPLPSAPARSTAGGPDTWPPVPKGPPPRAVPPPDFDRGDAA